MKTLIKHANKKTKLPILNTILVKDGVAYANDLDNEISYPIEQENGLYQAAGVKAGAWVKSDLNISDFPPMHLGEFIGQVYVKKSDFDFVALAMSTEETRYYLNGILFNKAGLVATDGHRMNIAEFKSGFNHDHIILPRNAVNIIQDCMKEEKINDITVFFARDSFYATVGKYKIKGKLVDGSFPDYTRVTGGISENVKIDTFIYDDIASHTKEIKALHKANGGRYGATVKFEGKTMSLVAGEYSKTWPIGFTFGDEIMGFNYDYMLDVILDGADIFIDNKRARSPIKFVKDNKTSILMPLRV